MYEIELLQEINQPPERVWDVLTRFREYDEWNPVITRMRGTLSVGAPIAFVLATGGRELNIQARMLTVDPGRELRWFGPSSKLLTPIFRGEHYLRVEPMGVGRSRLVHGETFTGFSVPLLWKKVKRELEQAYGDMNRAVKGRAETGQS
jgi:hypothetical protein